MLVKRILCSPDLLCDEAQSIRATGRSEMKTQFSKDLDALSNTISKSVLASIQILERVVNPAIVMNQWNRKKLRTFVHKLYSSGY